MKVMTVELQSIQIICASHQPRWSISIKDLAEEVEWMNPHINDTLAQGDKEDHIEDGAEDLVVEDEVDAAVSGMLDQHLDEALALNHQGTNTNSSIIIHTKHTTSKSNIIH